MTDNALLKAENLEMSFDIRTAAFGKASRKQLTAVNGVSFSI